MYNKIMTSNDTKKCEVLNVREITFMGPVNLTFFHLQF
jgi:hypothetical protein